MKILIFILFYLANYGIASNLRIPHIARKCALLIHMPSGINTFDMLERTLQANCFRYYNVAVDPQIKQNLSISYNKVIDADKTYQVAYVENDHLLYRIKTWLHTDAWDPFSTIQKQMKECNAQLIGSTFNNDDIHNTIPIFKEGLEYMNECFQEIHDDTVRLQTRLAKDYEYYTELAQNSTNVLKHTYQKLDDAKKHLSSTIKDFESNIIHVYTSTYDSG